MKTYSVKEAYVTLQGEGAQTGRAAVFLRFAGCNLWSGLERDRATAVCNFCDTDFVGTNGEKGGKFVGADALAAHVRDELGLSDDLAANPLSAALASGLTFCVAAAIPVLTAFLAPASSIIPAVLIVTVFALALLGALGAKAGGAPLLPATLRVVGWGVGAMMVTAAIGRLFGVAM